MKKRAKFGTILYQKGEDKTYLSFLCECYSIVLNLNVLNKMEAIFLLEAYQVNENDKAISMYVSVKNDKVMIKTVQSKLPPFSHVSHVPEN